MAMVSRSISPPAFMPSPTTRRQFLVFPLAKKRSLIAVQTNYSHLSPSEAKSGTPMVWAPAVQVGIKPHSRSVACQHSPDDLGNQFSLPDSGRAHDELARTGRPNGAQRFLFRTVQFREVLILDERVVRITTQSCARIR